MSGACVADDESGEAGETGEYGWGIYAELFAAGTVSVRKGIDVCRVKRVPSVLSRFSSRPGPIHPPRRRI